MTIRPTRRSLTRLVAITLLLFLGRSAWAQTKSRRHGEDAPERTRRPEAPGGAINRDLRLEATKRVQAVVEAFRTRLSIPNEIVVSVVPKNTLVVSVERLQDRDGVFSLSLEDGFLRLLTNADLGAVVAHELGHIWIFTHHPYLQTEELANQIAMRVVSRDDLTKVYEKLWSRVGAKGGVTYLPGE